MRHSRLVPLGVALTLLCSCATESAPPIGAQSQPRYAVDYADGFAYIPAGRAVAVNAHGSCKMISVAIDTPALARGGSLVVPFKTLGEWQSFQASALQGVSLSGC